MKVEYQLKQLKDQAKSDSSSKINEIILPIDGLYCRVAELRKSFCITKVGTLIKRITSKCFMCRKYRIKTCIHKMADLPKDRVLLDKTPFCHTRMDYFGRFHDIGGRTKVNAVYLEVAYSLDTDSCIHATRKCLARRGSIETIRSGNGTNRVGAERELRENIQKWNQSKIGRTLQQQSIKWEFNPPTASHLRGV